MTRTGKQSLRTLQGNANLIVLPADKGNATVLSNTEYYTHQITNLLEDPSKLAKDLTEAMEGKLLS